MPWECLPQHALFTSARLPSSIRQQAAICFGKEGLQSTYVVYPAKKPKAVDLKSRQGETKGRIYLGIYELEGDSLKICFSEHEQHRPTEFVARGTPGIRTLFVLEREKK